MRKMRVLIVGAGIGGMTLAALSRQRGLVPELIDRAPNFDHAGYMLLLYPLGSRILHGLGLFDKFEAMSEPIHEYVVCNGHSHVIHDYDLGEMSRRFGFMGQLKRGELITLLRSAAEDVPLRMGVSLQALHDSENEVVVSFSDGSEGRYDLVVGADGIHSETWKLVFGEQRDSETGWGLWLWWWNGGDCPPGVIKEFWGAGRFIGIYPTKGAIAAAAAGPVSDIGPEAIHGDGGNVRKAFAAYEGVAADIVATFPARTDDLFFWNLSDHRCAEWVKGRVALLGDSACAFLPTAGVGASMAMESAAVLADELSRTDAASLPLALELYQKRRKARAEGAQDDSRRLSKMMLVKSLPFAWGRDQLLKIYTLEMMIQNIARSLDEPI